MCVCVEVCVEVCVCMCVMAVAENDLCPVLLIYSLFAYYLRGVVY